MKVVILAGGFGTRISEEGHLKPKPMLEIGGKPILWHIMKIYSHYGFNEFIICCGYKQYIIKEWFANYYLHHSDVTFDFKSEHKMTGNKTDEMEPWVVSVVDTGLNTMTGGRVKRIQKYVGNETFMLTYGDGISNVNIKELVAFHQAHGKTGTLTMVSMEQRFGIIEADEMNTINSFREKSKADYSVINGGFMVFEPSVFDLIEDDSTVFEKFPLQKMAELGELKGFSHKGFWHCMDTQRDKQQLEELWARGNAPWKIWK